MRRAYLPLGVDWRGQSVLVGCLVLVVQHGDKEGLPGDPGLTSAGHAQASATAEWLHSTRAVTHVVTSPLRRALDTAELIASRLGLEVVKDVRLRERMNWVGHRPLDQFLTEWDRTSADRFFVPEHGDSSRCAAERFLAALDDLAQMGDEEVVAVAHGGVTVDALRTLLGDTQVLEHQPDLIEHGVPSCAITAFCHTSDGWTVEPPSTQHLDSLHQVSHICRSRPPT